MQHTQHHIQQLSTGGAMEVSAYAFDSGAPGPKIYLQANLHGPEVFGTAMLVEFLPWFAEMEKSGMKGSLTVVPCANPMGAGQTVYNAMVGRWNAHSGKNWNRIFPAASWKTHDEEAAYFAQMLARQGLSVEERLAATLRSLSSGADFVVDIHTTGRESVEHVFTFSWMNEAFAGLGAPIHLPVDEESFSGAFDESHVTPFLKNLPKESTPKACTWEVHNHGHIDAALVGTRVAALKNWLRGVWGASAETGTARPRIFPRSEHLCAPVAGYYAWMKKPGEDAQAGETYARIYQPWSGDVLEAKAEFPFTLIGIYGIAASADGEQIAVIARAA